MFENLDKSFKSRVVIGGCVVVFGVYMYKTHPNYLNPSFLNDWGNFKTNWLSAGTKQEKVSEPVDKPTHDEVEHDKAQHDKAQHDEPEIDDYSV